MRSRYEPRGVGFLALSLEPDTGLVRAAAEKMGIRMELAVAESELLAPLGVRGIPSTIFVSAEGRIVAAATGARDEAYFERRARELVDD